MVVILMGVSFSEPMIVILLVMVIMLVWWYVLVCVEIQGWFPYS